MRSLCRLAVGAALTAVVASPVAAQTSSSSQSQPSTQTPSAVVETRPATNTTLGDTGLWYVPLGEVLPKGKWSASAYYINWDRTESYTDVGDFAGEFAFGATDRLEVFGGMTLYRRIDADFIIPRGNGTPMDYPGINQGWADGFGDITIGAKYNFLSEWRQDPAAFALRAIMKLPTASYDEGLGSGSVNFIVDGVLSKEVEQNIDISGYVGLNFRADSDNEDLSHGFRWGGGIGWPSRSPLKLIAEFNGEAYFDGDILTSLRDIVDDDFELPDRWLVDKPADLFVGVNYQARSGWFIGGGVGLAATTETRIDALASETSNGDRFQASVRLGYHPGERIYVPPPPPAPPPTPAPAANRAPTVKARCEPCTVEIGKTSTVTADAQDPDGDTLSYKWSAPAGTFANPADRQTIFTCPATEGAVPVTVTVSDGKGGTATDTVTIQCVRPARKEYTFEDVHFDFDRYSLRPEAARILDDAIKAMQADPELRLTLEGHTCNIGTAEYNLALGERRAVAVRDYLASRGIAATRLQTVSYGEERPKHDNSREETRRLNRRAALTVRLQ